ncbi:21475_t:CDS:1, partial [Cetraspora pellucida]
KNKVELELDDDDIEIIIGKKFSKHYFLNLSQKKLKEKLEEHGMQLGPAYTIAMLVKKLKSEAQDK